MKICQIKLYRIENELKQSFFNAIAEIIKRETIIVEVMDENGVSGYGEVVAFQTPWYTPETIVGAWWLLKAEILPQVVGRCYTHPNAFYEQFCYIKGNQMALAGLETALWDLAAKRDQVPLYQYLGGIKNRVPVGIAIGRMSLEKRCKKIAQALEDGYQRIKLKIDKHDALEELRILRKKFPDAPFMVDFNGSCTVADFSMLKQLDAFHLQMFEQPLHENDRILYSQLQHMLQTPLCLDESITSLSDFILMCHLQAAQIAVVKLGRVGGYTQALQIHNYAAQMQIPLWVGGMLESGIGRAHNLALATLSGFVIPADISSSDHYYEKDITIEKMEVQDGYICLPNQAGIGFTIDSVALEALMKESYEISI